MLYFFYRPSGHPPTTRDRPTSHPIERLCPSSPFPPFGHRRPIFWVEAFGLGGLPLSSVFIHSFFQSRWSFPFLLFRSFPSPDLIWRPEDILSPPPPPPTSSSSSAFFSFYSIRAKRERRCSSADFFFFCHIRRFFVPSLANDSSATESFSFFRNFSKSRDTR